MVCCCVHELILIHMVCWVESRGSHFRVICPKLLEIACKLTVVDVILLTMRNALLPIGAYTTVADHAKKIGRHYLQGHKRRYSDVQL